MFIVKIDTEELERLLFRLGSKAKLATHRAIESGLTKHANMLVKELNRRAPSQRRTDDERYARKLNQSFYFNRADSERTIMTSEPRKLGIVSQDTRPHYIFPRFKQALWWPGLAHPVSWVGPPHTRIHPGTKANTFVQDVFRDRGSDIDVDMIANMIVNDVTGNESAGSVWNSLGGNDL